MDCIYIALLSKALYNLCLSFTHPFTPTAIGCHARYQPARQEQSGVRRLAQGHFDTPRVGSNQQPSDCQTAALTSWAISPHSSHYLCTSWEHSSVRNICILYILMNYNYNKILTTCVGIFFIGAPFCTHNQPTPFCPPERPVAEQCRSAEPGCGRGTRWTRPQSWEAHRYPQENRRAERVQSWVCKCHVSWVFSYAMHVFVLRLIRNPSAHYTTDNKFRLVYSRQFVFMNAAFCSGSPLKKMSLFFSLFD